MFGESLLGLEVAAVIVCCWRNELSMLDGVMDVNLLGFIEDVGVESDNGDKVDQWYSYKTKTMLYALFGFFVFLSLHATLTVRAQSLLPDESLLGDHSK